MTPATEAQEPNTKGISDLDRLLSKSSVVEITTLSAVQIWRKARAGTFPRPVQISDGRVAWREADIRAWLAGLTTSTIAPKARGRKRRKR